MFDLALAAREQTAALQEERNAAMVELAALKTEIEQSKQFDADKENYVRERNWTGATVYREKDSAGPQGQSPYYCPSCFAKKQISILNPVKSTATASTDYGCAVCKAVTPLLKLRVQ